MSTLRRRVSLWLLASLLAFALLMAVFAVWVRLPIRWDLKPVTAALLATLLVGHTGCAYLSPFLPEGGWRRHLMAVGVGFLTSVGLLAVCICVAWLSPFNRPA